MAIVNIMSMVFIFTNEAKLIMHLNILSIIFTFALCFNPFYSEFEND